jgi:hypothetical protein
MEWIHGLRGIIRFSHVESLFFDFIQEYFVPFLFVVVFVWFVFLYVV